jgi:hypothetical protein
MRFDAKHNYFMHEVNNYKQACATMAKLHQMKLADLLSGEENSLVQPLSNVYVFTDNCIHELPPDVVVKAIASSAFSQTGL